MKTLFFQKTAKILLVSFLFLTQVSLTAQSTSTDQSKRKEKIEAAKIAYMTDKIKLTTAEAEKFWPIYNEYSDKREGLMKEYRKKAKALRPSDSVQISETNADQLIDLYLQNEQQVLDLKKEYFPKFKKVIGSRKVVNMFFAEKEFNKLLLEKLKENHGKTDDSD